MSDVNTLLSQRLKKNESSSKMSVMAKQSANGNLTSFSGIFSLSELSEYEKKSLETILQQYGTGKEDVSTDLTSLILITSEVKAINNQAAILHGERIKKAHSIFTRYKDGAFTAWLIAAYGNRQTPYNFMQYYLFYDSLPKNLRPLVESMPRQAVYTLASREGSFEKKQKIVESFKGQTKIELLNLIREAFPLKERDKRRKDLGQDIINQLKYLSETIKAKALKISKNQRQAIFGLLDIIHSHLK